MTTISESTFESVRQLVAAKTIECPDHVVGDSGGTARCREGRLRTGSPGMVPDPAYAPLLTLLQEECPGPRVRWHRLCPGPDTEGHSHSRFPYWQGVPDGALEGVLLKALIPLALAWVGSGPDNPTTALMSTIAHLLWREGDTRQTTLEVIEKFCRNAQSNRYPRETSDEGQA